MPTINLPPSIRAVFTAIESRLQKLETGRRFTAPATPQLSSLPTVTGSTSGDPSVLTVGDIWLNTTSNTPKYVDATGAVTTLGGSAGSPWGPRYLKTGYLYTPIGVNGATSATNLTANLLTALPFYAPTSINAAWLGIYVDTTNGLSGGIRCGIYSNSSNDDYPNALILDAGLYDTSTANGTSGNNILTITPTPLVAGNLYWLVAVRQGVSNPTIECLLSLRSDSGQVLPASTPTGWGGGYGNSWAMSGVTGALPATWSATKTLSLTAPLVMIGF